MFAIFSWGIGGYKSKKTQGNEPIVGTVNGQEILYNHYKSLLEEEYKLVREQSGGFSLSERQRDQMNERVWDALVEEILIRQEVKRRKIRVTDKEIAMEIKNNPPGFIKSHSVFQKNGQFDWNRYHAVLNDAQYAEFFVPLVNYFRSALPLQKLQRQVIEEVILSDEEVFNAYRKDNELINVRYIFFDPETYADKISPVMDTEIEAYYKSNRKDFQIPEGRKIQYVVFDIRMSKDDSLLVRENCQYILDELKAGANFGELAQEYSEDAASSQRLGDLGYFGEGVMVKPFEEAVKSARIGDIIGPMETQFGLHIIQVQDKKRQDGQTVWKARHILLKYEASQETIDMILDNAQYFAEAAGQDKGKQFSHAARQAGLSVMEAVLYQADSLNTGVDLPKRIQNRVMHEKKGFVSNPVFTENQVIVFKITEEVKPSLQPILEAEPVIRKQLIKHKRRSAALAAAESFLKRTMDLNSFEKAAEEKHLKVQETGLLSASTIGTVPGLDAKIGETAFELGTREFSEVIQGIRGITIIQLTDRRPVDPGQYEAEKDIFKQNLLQKKRADHFKNWMDGVMDKADIKDYRYKFL